MRLRRTLFWFALLGSFAFACSSEDGGSDEAADDDRAEAGSQSDDEVDAAPSEPSGDAGAHPGDTADETAEPDEPDETAEPDESDSDEDPVEPTDAGSSPVESDAASGEPPDDQDAGAAHETTSDPDAGAPLEPDAGEPDFEGADGGELPELPRGDVPPELVGVWQETRASADDYEFDDGFGGSFSLTSGFSVQLKISPEGRYYFAHYSSGASTNCQTVSQFDQSVGTAVLDGNTLTLQPEQREIESISCDDSRVYDGGTEPIVFTVSLSEDRQYYGGMRMYDLALEGWSHPLDLTSLFRLPDYEAYQPAQPVDFVLGEDGAYDELQGLWAAAPGSDVDFYNPQTGAYYLPELNGSPHRWVRFDGDAYEMAVALQSVNDEGVCKSDLIYYESGTALFQATEDVGGQGTHFIGDTRFDSTDSRLIVNIRECDEDDGVFALELQPLSSYYRFNLYIDDPLMFELNCGVFERSEWQSLLCEQGFAGYYKR